ncbi:hypothetical protein D3C76_1510560 [compost metagenome]
MSYTIQNHHSEVGNVFVQCGSGFLQCDFNRVFNADLAYKRRPYRQFLHIHVRCVEQVTFSRHCNNR